MRPVKSWKKLNTVSDTFKDALDCRHLLLFHCRQFYQCSQAYQYMLLHPGVSGIGIQFFQDIGKMLFIENALRWCEHK